MEPIALTQLRERRLIAVIRGPSPTLALEAALAVVKGGITMIEVTFTVPEAPKVIAQLAGDSRLVVGAGTVLSAEQAAQALDAGARFLIAPNVEMEVAEAAHAAGVMYCPGAFTTNEILAARAADAHVVKIYPVGVVGGPHYIEVIRDPLPDIPMLAAGGTTLENVGFFLRAGCIGVGLGASLADPKLAVAEQYDEITRRAKAFTQRLTAADAAAAPVRRG